MQEYQKPELEIINISIIDIITASGDPEDTGDDLDNWGSWQ